MGNSASNANPNRTQNVQRTDNQPTTTTVMSNRDASLSPGPGNPHRSLRSKKKSLELPDLAGLSLSPSSISNRGRQRTPAIPIPAAPHSRSPFSHYSEVRGIATQRQRPRNFPSTTSVLQYEFDDVVNLEPSTHIPFPPPSRAQQIQQQQSREQAHRRTDGQQRDKHSARQQAQVSKIQDLYDRSVDPHHPAAPPSSPASAPRPVYIREVVRSSIPIVLGSNAIQTEVQESTALSPIQEDLSADPVPYTIVWRGGGSDVILSRAGDDEWKGRQPMERQYVRPLFFFFLAQKWKDSLGA